MQCKVYRKYNDMEFETAKIKQYMQAWEMLNI